LAGIGLPPIMGRLRDATGSYHIALVMLAVALIAGGLLGLKLGPPRRRAATVGGAAPTGSQH